MMPGESGFIFWGLYDQMIRAAWAHKTLVELFGKGEERLEILRRTAPSFFSDLRVALANDLILRITRMLDRPGSGQRRNISLPALLEELETRPNRRLLDRTSRKIEKARAIGDRLRWARDKKIAHNSREVIEKGNDYSSSNVTRIELETLLRLLADALGSIENHYAGGRTDFFEIGRTGGVNALLRALERDLDARGCKASSSTRT